MTRQSNKFYAGRGGNLSIFRPRHPGRPKTKRWRSLVPESEKNFFLSVKYFTLFDRFLNDDA
jgi:hypothetical protein